MVLATGEIFALCMTNMFGFAILTK